MTDQATANLQWKGTDACYDFYCPCGYEGANDQDGACGASDAPDAIDNHRDGLFLQEYRCAGCGEWWHFSNTLIAKPGKFFRDDDGYGCDTCKTGHTP